MANLKYPLDLDGNTREYKHYIRFQTLRRRITSRTSSLGPSCSLYIPPDALKTSYSQSYADTDLGSAGSAIKNLNVSQMTELAQADSTAGVLNVIKAVAGGNQDNLVTSTLGALGREITGAIAPGVTSAITNRIGALINNHKALIYQGPGGFRVFNYNFSMIPESETEANEIRAIVKFFKMGMHPETGRFGMVSVSGNPQERDEEEVGFIPNSNTNTSLLFKYPDEFKIEIFPNSTRGGRRNEKLFKIDRCFLESFNVDYSTQGATSFFDTGDPVTTTISMQFKETTIMTKEKIRQGF